MGVAADVRLHRTSRVDRREHVLCDVRAGHLREFARRQSPLLPRHDADGRAVRADCDRHDDLCRRADRQGRQTQTFHLNRLHCLGSDDHAVCDDRRRRRRKQQYACDCALRRLRLRDDPRRLDRQRRGVQRLGHRRHRRHQPRQG